MLRNPTYEVLKMKLAMRRNDHRGFHERARGIARATARQKSKTLKNCRNFYLFDSTHFKHFPLLVTGLLSDCFLSFTSTRADVRWIPPSPLHHLVTSTLS